MRHSGFGTPGDIRVIGRTAACLLLGCAALAGCGRSESPSRAGDTSFLTALKGESVELPVGLGPLLGSGQEAGRMGRFRFDFGRFQQQVLSAEALKDEARVVDLQLFDGITVSLPVRAVTPHRVEPNTFIWSGRPKSDKFGSFTLVVRDHVMAGTVQIDRMVYTFIPVKDDVIAVTETDQSRFPREAPPITPPEDPVRMKSGAPATPKDAADGSPVLRVLLVLPESSFGWVCDSSLFGIKVLDLVAAIYESNLNDVFEGFKPSGVSSEVVARCIDMKPEGGDLQNDLGNIRVDAETAALRDALDSDLVSFIVPESSFCGRGYMTYPVSSSDSVWAFSVVKASCALSNYSFAHELGHNLGMNHDREADGAQTSDTCNYGHIFPIKALGASFSGRTTMAYGDACGGCPRFGFYSSPDTLSFAGVFTVGPMGVDCGEPSSDGSYSRANNRQQLIDAAPIAGAFR